MAKRFDFKENFLIGIISDTHGYVSASALTALAESDLILHAGDIGQKDVLVSLKSIAPLIAVRGNMDFGAWARQLRQKEIVHIGKIVVYIVHDVQRLQLESNSIATNAVIFGHSHRPSIQDRNGVLFFNPGSASYPKFGDSATVGLLRLQANEIIPEFIQLRD
jgi:putative phosphoesterase